MRSKSKRWSDNVQAVLLNPTAVLAAATSSLPGPVLIGVAVLASANAVRLVANAVKDWQSDERQQDIAEFVTSIDSIQGRLQEIMALPKATLGADVFEWCNRTNQSLAALRKELLTTKSEELHKLDSKAHGKTLATASQKLEELAKRLKNG